MSQIIFVAGGITATFLIARGLYTGQVRQRSIPRRWVPRESEPGRFWLHIAFYAAAGAACLGKAVSAF